MALPWAALGSAPVCLGLSNLQHASSQELLLHPNFPEEAVKAQNRGLPRVTQGQLCLERPLLFLLNRWGNQGTEGLSDLPKVTQILSSRTRVLTRAFGHRAFTHLPPSLTMTVARPRAGTWHSAVCKAFAHAAPHHLSAQGRPRAHNPLFTERAMKTRQG